MAGIYPKWLDDQSIYPDWLDMDIEEFVEVIARFIDRKSDINKNIILVSKLWK